MKNQLLIACAGAGKTTYLVELALNCSETVLITTFTEENKKEIRNKILQLNNGVIPLNITIQTWFSFLIEHGVKPYQGKLIDQRINGMILVNKKSGVKYYKGKTPVYYSENDVKNHYFNKDMDIYSDKLSKFTIRCNERNNGYVIQRISQLFKNIFIDEVQDMAGYDLEIIKLLFKSQSIIKLAGDPRQVTYHTHFADKYKKYSKGQISEFIKNECKSISCNIDDEKLMGSWRNNKYICDFANSIFPEYPKCTSLQTEETNHDGIILVKEKDVDIYLEKYLPMQLRYSRAKKVNTDYEVRNFGESKGATFDRVLIYPTAKILDWIINKKEINNFEIECKLYVATTRAKYSVAIVCKNNINSDLLTVFQPE